MVVRISSLLLILSTALAAVAQAPRETGSAVTGPEDGSTTTGDFQPASFGAGVDIITIDLYPNPATVRIHVVVHGIENGLYLIGIDGESHSWNRLVHVQDGVPLVIDIEKVETGVYTFWIETGGEMHALEFVKVE